MLKTTILFIFVIIIALICFQDSENIYQNKKVLNIALADEPPSLDSAKATDTISFSLTQALFEGLYRYHGGKYIPGIAKGEPEVSDDGKHYIFHLRKAFWSDGKPVTAYDFEYAWKRVLKPETGSKYAFIIADYIKHGKGCNNGTVDCDTVGVTAINYNTLEVILESPTPFFKSLTTFGTYMPVRKDIIENFGSQYASSPETMIYNGPFVLYKWIHDNEVVFKKNPDYWQKDRVKLNYVVSPVVRDISTRIMLFETGELHITMLRGNYVEIFTKKGFTQDYVDGSTFYVMVNPKRIKGLNNPKVRRALALAIDRNNFIDKVFKLPYVPATNFVNPAIHGYQDLYRKEYPGDFFKPFDPVAAKRLFQEGLKEEGIRALNRIEFLIDDGETSRMAAEFIQENWRKHLGLDIFISPVPFKVRLDRAHNHEYDVVFAGWGPDYDDPMTFLDMWITDGPFNEVYYSNQQYDALIKQAKSSGDNKFRMEQMAKAEKILMDDMPIIPLYHRSSVYAVSPLVANMFHGAFNPDPDWMFADIQEENR